MLDGIRYHYGFEATNSEFTSEWLYEIPKAHRRKLFEREGNEYEFGCRLKGQNKSIERDPFKQPVSVSGGAERACGPFCGLRVLSGHDFH
ncbi:MAG: hypothetical protein OXH79_21145 [Boseongicola sp.]|nr:hypothetical protein [Boseongicola sp.]